MQNNKDHVQAYQFATARLSSALVNGQIHAGDAPLRRSGLGVVWGVAVAVLLCGGFYVYGLISPGGNTSWQQARSIVVEKETGNRYLYLDGVLYPTLNTASAMLFWGPGGAPVFRTVSRNSLDGVRRGPAVGIPGAPDTVPGAREMLPAAWSVCAGSVPDLDPAGSVLDLDPARPAAPLGDLRLVVTGPDGAPFVVWRDTVYPASPAALSALGLADVAPVAVPAPWLAALAFGPVLEAPPVPGAGGPGVPGAEVGRIVSVPGPGGIAQAYVVRADGLAPINPTTAALFAARRDAPPPVPFTAAQVAGVPASADTSGLTALPDLLGAGTHRPDTETVCVRQQGAFGDPAPGTVLLAALPSDPALPPGLARTAVPTGRGMLVARLPLPERPSEAQQFLITDQGLRFPLSRDAVQALAPGAAPVWLPGPVLDAVPVGPALLTGPAALAPPARAGSDPGNGT